MFDPDTINAMGEAFDKVRASIGEQPGIRLHTIAVEIISAARRGERDPERLCEAALTALGFCPSHYLKRKANECYALAAESRRNLMDFEGQHREELIKWEQTWLTLAETFETLAVIK